MPSKLNVTCLIGYLKKENHGHIFVLFIFRLNNFITLLIHEQVLVFTGPGRSACHTALKHPPSPRWRPWPAPDKPCNYDNNSQTQQLQNFINKHPFLRFTLLATKEVQINCTTSSGVERTFGAEYFIASTRCCRNESLINKKNCRYKKMVKSFRNNHLNNHKHISIFSFINDTSIRVWCKLIKVLTSTR